jgi:hypothetical protein
MVKRKMSVRSPAISQTPRKDSETGVNARPSSEFDLTPGERKLLADPDWITEDEADVIIAERRLRTDEMIPLEKIFERNGYTVSR